MGALCEALERPDLVEKLHTPPEGQPALTEELAAIFATRTAAEWVEQLPAAAAVGPVNSVDDLFDDPHVQARGSIVELTGSGAGTRVVRSPVRLRKPDGTEDPFAPEPPPALGAHTDDALAAAGFTPDEIAALHADGAV